MRPSTPRSMPSSTGCRAGARPARLSGPLLAVVAIEPARRPRLHRSLVAAGLVRRSGRMLRAARGPSASSRGKKAWPANRFQQKRLCRCKPATVSKQLAGNRDFLIAAGTGVCTVVGDWAGLVESRPLIIIENAPAQEVTNRGLKAMARGSFFAGMMKSGALAAALLAGAAVPGYAQDAPPKLTLSGSATMTTDYMFRSVTD